MKLLTFLKDEKPYAIMLAFVIACHLLAFFNAQPSLAPKTNRGVVIDDRMTKLQEALKEKFSAREEAKKFIEENAGLGMVLSLFSIAGFLAIGIGLIFLIRFLYLKFLGREPINPTFRYKTIRWGMLDITKVVIIMFFLGIWLSIIDGLITSIFNISGYNREVQMMIHTMISDTLAVGIILFFVIKKYRHRLSTLGLSLKRWFRNILIGLSAYITILPVLVLVLMIVIWFVEWTGFKPPVQPVVEIFIRETRPRALIYFTIFVSLLGPLAEEVFFRAFAYPAIKKATGIRWGLFITAFLFAALHADKIAFLPVFTLGLLLGYLYEKTRSLIPCLTVHVIHNGITVFFIFLLKQLLNTV